MGDLRGLKLDSCRVNVLISHLSKFTAGRYKRVHHGYYTGLDILINRRTLELLKAQASARYSYFLMMEPQYRTRNLPPGKPQAYFNDMLDKTGWEMVVVWIRTDRRCDNWDDDLTMSLPFAGYRL